MLVVYLAYEPKGDDFWLNTPPGFTNIRHAGYHVAVMSVFCLYFFLPDKDKDLTDFIIPLFCLSVIWAFNFWMGGRGSVLAALLGSLFVLFFDNLFLRQTSLANFLD